MKFKKLSPTVYSILSLIGLSLLGFGYVIFEALSRNVVLLSPDSPTELIANSTEIARNSFLNFSPSCITFDALLKCVVNHLHYSEFSYIIIVVLTSLAMYAFLRSLKLAHTSSVLGGIAMAFSGYHLTLFSAGHRGYLISVVYALCVFALTESLFRRQRVWDFVLLVYCAVCAFAMQPDVMLFFAMLYAAYLIYRFIKISAENNGCKAYFKENRKRLFTGIAVFFVTLLFIGYPTYNKLVNEVLGSREAQIKASASQTISGASDEDVKEKEKASQWVFATDWSLPFYDVAELIIPNLHGYDTANPAGPYYGHIGRSINWNPKVNDPTSFANYRQHTIYLGVIQVSFALFAIVFSIILFAKRKNVFDGVSNEAEKHNLDSMVRNNGVILFFAIALPIFFLLSLGRYTPIYKIFYAIPFMDKIRCPIKFLHVVEFVVCTLFAFGVDRLILLRSSFGWQKRAGKIAQYVCIAFAMVCLILSVGVKEDAITTLLDGTNIPASFAPLLTDLYKGACYRSTWLFILCALSLGLIVFRNPILKTKTLRIGWFFVICLIMMADMTSVAKKYVHTRDISAVLQDNPIVEDYVKNFGKNTGISYSHHFLVGADAPKYAFFENFDEKYFIRNGEPFVPYLATDGVVLSSIELRNQMTKTDKVFKRWALYGTDIILVSPNYVNGVVKGGLGKVFGTYKVSSDEKISRTGNSNEITIFALKSNELLPSASVYYDAINVNAENVYKKIAEENFDVAKSIAVEFTDELPKSDLMPTEAKWIVLPTDTKGTYAKVEANALQKGLLYIRDYALLSNMKVLVNGVETSYYKANVRFLCVPLEKGKNIVEFRSRIDSSKVLYICCVAIMVVLALAMKVYSYKKSV